MKKRLWVRLFISIAAVFAVFVAIIALANSSLLSYYFIFKEERLLLESSKELSDINLENTDEIQEKMSEIGEKYNFDIEIYEKNGRIIYTTRGAQIMDFIHSGFDRPGFSMNHEQMETLKRKVKSDGRIIETARSNFTNEEYLLCKTENDSIITELRIPTDLLSGSAQTASEFMIIIAAVCLVGSLVWIFLFSKKFTEPIVQMSEITEQMSELDFSKKVTVNSTDEIGQLGESINNMSASLDRALSELRLANLKLTDEIELERRLDVMRRAFVANVSHELKTPLSIISGYAEGLKLNVNSDSKDNYCDTIIDETERMNSLVLSILELSKYESGQIPFNNEIFDISSLARNTAEKILKSRADILLENRIPEKTLISFDITQTEQILKSYLENAAVHTIPNGRVTLSAEKFDGYVKIKIENEGEQIPTELMPNIWQSFWRADKSHSREAGRFGLGLSIVSAIVTAAGSSCGVYNTESGVCFWFTANKE